VFIERRDKPFAIETKSRTMILTHALVGAAIGEMLLGRRMVNRALGWGALVGVAPYVGMAALPFLDTAGRLGWQRGPGDSLVVVGLLALLAARPLARLWRRDKIAPARAGTFVFLTLCAHVLIKCTGGDGVALFWPFPVDRVAFANVPPMDPLLVIPLLVCLPWLALKRGKKEWGKRRRILGWGMGLTCAYLGFTTAMKVTATAGFDADLARHGAQAGRRLIVPVAHHPLAWRAVVDDGDTLWVGHRPVFQRASTPVRWTIYARGGAAAAAFADEREVRRIQRVSDGYWIARPHKRGLWIADLRAGETRQSGGRDHAIDQRMRRAWNFEPAAPKDRLIPSHAPQPSLPTSARQSIHHLLGRDNTSELTPRLAGVPGQFPETLQVANGQ